MFEWQMTYKASLTLPKSDKELKVLCLELDSILLRSVLSSKVGETT